MVCFCLIFQTVSANFCFICILRCDVKDKCPKNEICKKNGPATRYSTIDMKAVAESDELKDAGVVAQVSHDAGR